MDETLPKIGHSEHVEELVHGKDAESHRLSFLYIRLGNRICKKIIENFSPTSKFTDI